MVEWKLVAWNGSCDVCFRSPCRWNHAFKNQITTLQSQAKNRANPNRSEVQANLSLFLEAASGFYTQVRFRWCSRRRSVLFPSAQWWFRVFSVPDVSLVHLDVFGKLNVGTHFLPSAPPTSCLITLEHDITVDSVG